MSDIKKAMLKVLEKYHQGHRVSLDEKTPTEDRLAIRKCGSSSWEVFYTERGTAYDRKVFLTEKEACVYMLRRLLRGFTEEDFLEAFYNNML